MLGGAFCGAVASYYSGSPWVGLLGAIAGGAALALLYAVTAIRFRADQVVVGIAVNLLVTGATRFFLRLAFHSSANSPRVPGFGAEQSGTGLAALASNPLIWLGIIAVAVMGVVALPHAVRPAGARVGRTSRGGAIGGRAGQPSPLHCGSTVRNVGGARRSISGARPASVQREMTAGRGFIALAATIFGRWDPLRAALACLFFAAAETLQIQLQGAQIVPSQFVEMIPYALTIVALAGVVGRAVPPAALGRASE
jgi:simple sugar transport system permease protein